jgi:hypothetical protein
MQISISYNLLITGALWRNSNNLPELKKLSTGLDTSYQQDLWIDRSPKMFDGGIPSKMKILDTWTSDPRTRRAHVDCSQKTAKKRLLDINMSFKQQTVQTPRAPFTWTRLIRHSWRDEVPGKILVSRKNVFLVN